MNAPLRQPVFFLPHGGGPWPFVDVSRMISAHDVEVMRAFFADLPKKLTAAPKALLVISAHWEEDAPTVMTSPRPPILYDYGGFPPEAYAIEWPAPGNPSLAERVVQLLAQAGIAAKTDPRRGFDHGTFIPFKLSWPNAEIPTIQLSLQRDLEPAQHIAIGRALEPLRDEAVLILGSGMSYHNMRGFSSGNAHAASVTFDDWLADAATAEPQLRSQMLGEWASAPAARAAHPREEHLLPLMVIAGAAGDDVGRVIFRDDWMGVRISAYRYG